MTESQNTNYIALAQLSAVLSFHGRLSQSRREYLQWCRQMTRRTGKRFPR